MTFWDHLDILRKHLLRIIIVLMVLTVVAFVFKDELFAVVLAPVKASEVGARIINTGLTTQFVTHVTTSFYAALLLAAPYVIYELFTFISPGLYANERRHTIRLVLSGYIMFMLGTAFCYFILFPITFDFLGGYQVDTSVDNLIGLDSYIDTFLVLHLMMGAVFEMPVLCWLLALIGLIDHKMMARYRRHALVVILILAAIITPTSDAITLTIVTLPMYLLYELSILIVRITRKREQ